jgi:hypothetical protein
VELLEPSLSVLGFGNGFGLALLAAANPDVAFEGYDFNPRPLPCGAAGAEKDAAAHQHNPGEPKSGEPMTPNWRACAQRLRERFPCRVGGGQ